MPKSIAYSASARCSVDVIGTGSLAGETVSFASSRTDGVFVTGLQADGSYITGTACTLDSTGSCNIWYTLAASGVFILPRTLNVAITAVYPGDANNLGNTNSTTVQIHGCWLNPCLVNTLYDKPTPLWPDYSEWICVSGNTPADFWGGNDCKIVDQDLTSTGITYQALNNIGIVVPGAGMFAAAAGMIPGVGTLAMATAIAYAATVNEGLSAGEVLTLEFDASIPPLPFLSPLVTYCAFATKGCPDEGTIVTLSALAALVPAVGAFYISSVAVALTIACGGVGSVCYGANITSTMLTNFDNIQSKQVPIALPDIGLWGGQGGLLGLGIGWSKVNCSFSLGNGASCPSQSQCQGSDPTLAGCPVPGSASPDNNHLSNSGQPEECAVGKVLALSIGYDGDATFNVSVNDTAAFGLVNKFNFKGGELGAPGGIVVEIPVADRPLWTPIVTQLHKGTAVHVCGRWVTDMRDFWNELHPVTSLSIVTVSATEFFTDGNLNLLPPDSSGNPSVNVTLAGGVVKSTNPGRVLAWVKLTNVGDSPVQSLKVDETLPVDWAADPPWMPSVGAIQVFFANTTSLATNPEITQPSTITVSKGNPAVVHLAIADFRATVVGHLLMPGDALLLSVKLSYALKGTSQSTASYPRSYIDTATVMAWPQSSFIGAESTDSSSAPFKADAKVVG